MSVSHTIEVELSATSLEALRPIVRPWMTPEELYSAIQVLKTEDDARFPRGKWATIQALEGQLTSPTRGCE